MLSGAWVLPSEGNVILVAHSTYSTEYYVLLEHTAQDVEYSMPRLNIEVTVKGLFILVNN